MGYTLLMVYAFYVICLCNHVMCFMIFLIVIYAITMSCVQFISLGRVLFIHSTYLCIFRVIFTQFIITLGNTISFFIMNQAHAVLHPLTLRTISLFVLN